MRNHRAQFDCTWTSDWVTKWSWVGTPWYIKPPWVWYAGTIMTGGGCICTMAWFGTLMTVGACLRCFNSRCIWHQAHHSQQQVARMSLHREPLIPYRFRMAALRERTAGGGTHTGNPQAVVTAQPQHRSNNGRKRFSPNLSDTVQARQGQHQKP